MKVQIVTETNEREKKRETHCMLIRNIKTSRTPTEKIQLFDDQWNIEG